MNPTWPCAGRQRRSWTGWCWKPRASRNSPNSTTNSGTPHSSRTERWFTAQELDFLKDFDEARLTYIQLKEFYPESGKVIAQDVFDGSIYTLYDKGVSVQGRPQDIVSCRLVRFPGKDGYVFEALASSVQPPQLKEFLVKTFGPLAGREYPGKPPAEAIHAFLKTYPMNFFWVEMWILHLSLSRKPPTMVTTDGEELVFIKARFSARNPEALVSAMARPPEPGRGPEAKPLSQDELKALAPQLEEHFLSRWLKEKIPALGNRTPVQAAKDPKGRKQLLELLDIMENQSFRGMPGGMVASFDVDKARERLGLAP